jgi:nitroimidazol reductase NimA-like FMN-containing flavoprotein (pyridoxamine 5'-phosphate oxidase superfamily)
MTTEIDRRTGLEILSKDECTALLRTRSLGRIAVVVDGQPLVFPVNFAIDGNAVVFRTDFGTKLYGARHGPVAFECDGTDDPRYHTAWSVLATGDASEVHNSADLEHLNELPLVLWSPGPKSIWLRIQPRTLTGRRILPHRGG